MITKVSIGDIIKFEGELFLVTLNRDVDGYMCLTYLTSCNAGTTTLRHVATVCNNIERRYGGIDEYVSTLKNKLQSINNQLQYFIDRDDMNKSELQECYEIIDFKNKEIERLHKEELSTVNKDTFDKAVNDMLNKKDISTVEEVSAIMKLRSAIY